MALLKLEDANGRRIEFDDSKIFNINGDIDDSANVSDFVQNRVEHVHDVQFVDSKGKVLDQEKLITDAAVDNSDIIAIDVQAESTHSGKNHNFCIYYEDSMEKDCETFMNPYHKPMLKNHNTYSGEPIGRVSRVWFGPSELTNERSAIHTVTRVTDRDAIRKFIDGRYRTLSIGGSIGTCTCNICGKNILKDGKFKWCGHWKGETYKNEICYWGARDITYNEHSVVNNPADDFAQVMKVTVIRKSDANNGDDHNNNEGGKDAVNGNETNGVQKLKDSICSAIEDILGKGSSGNNAQQQDSSQQNTDSTQTQDSQHEDNQQQTGAAETSDTNDAKIKELEDAKKALEDELQKAKDSVETLKNEKEAALRDSQTYKERLTEIAQDYKEFLTGYIVDKENVTDAAARKKELMGMSMKELNAVIDSINRVASRRTPGTAEDPTLANDKGNTQDSAGGESDGGQQNGGKSYSVDDYVNRIINRKR